MTATCSVTPRGRSCRAPTGREIIDSSEVRLQELGDPARRVVERTVTRQDAAGRAVSIVEHSQMGPAWSQVEARIGADEVEVTRQTPSERRSARIAVPAGVRFDGGEGLLPGWDIAATPRLEFDNFNLDAMIVERVTIEAMPGAAPDAEGRITVIRKRYDGGELRAVARLLLDRERRILAFTQPMFGTSITTRITDRETALRPHPFYSSFSNMMVRAPYRMSAAALQGHIRYRFAFRDGIEFPLPQTGEQRVGCGRASWCWTFAQTCGPGLPTDAASLCRARSRPPGCKAIIRGCARSPGQWRYAVSASAQDGAAAGTRAALSGRGGLRRPFLGARGDQRRVGDCTEAAVRARRVGPGRGHSDARGQRPRLFAPALSRRQPTPSCRTAGSSPMWTDAWRSFDLALDAVRYPHIALTVGDGDARSIMAAIQLASLLDWEADGRDQGRPGAAGGSAFRAGRRLAAAAFGPPAAGAGCLVLIDDGQLGDRRIGHLGRLAGGIVLGCADDLDALLGVLRRRR